MNGRLWAPVDLEYLRGMYAIGINRNDIACELKRSVTSIKSAVRKHAMKRDQSRFVEAVKWYAMAEEKFAAVQHRPGYFVSDSGRVLSMRLDNPGTILKPWIDKDGYAHVNLVKPTGGMKRTSVHHIVAAAFLPPRPNGKGIAHRDGVPSHNAASNLRWATQAENCADKERHGTAQRGSKHGRAQITEATARRVREVIEAGSTSKEASEITGVSIHIVNDIRSGKTWRHA